MSIFWLIYQVIKVKKNDAMATPKNEHKQSV